MTDQIKFTFEGSSDGFDRLVGRTPPPNQPQQQAPGEQLQAIAQMAALFYQQQQVQQQQIERLKAEMQHQRLSPSPTYPQLNPQQLAQAYLPPAQQQEFAPPPPPPQHAVPVYQQTGFAPPPPEARAITVEASTSPPTLPPPPPPPPQSTAIATTEQLQPVKPSPIVSLFKWSLTQPGCIAFYLALIAAVGFAIARHAPIVDYMLSNKQPKPTQNVSQPIKPVPKPPSP